ncbi:hypothetical protein F0562_005448 [Nyssa sinensis]|uniref:Uncharacterized protein n=1 Tax=Nyssa sinensis TaxID=561372 RepID=A0A5J5AK75_9ASTE|nr:hypothetical protein F0562_005448 [Nyssa sinensis]
MGNYISCTLSAPTGKHSRSAKVIFPTGEIRQFHQPIKAAELMLETPNFFLVNSRSLQVGRRFSALNADEDLEMANVYVMFPMKRVNSIVTAADMGALFLTANSAAKRVAAGNVKILPAPPKIEESTPKLNLDDIDEFLSPEFKHRVSLFSLL